MKYIECPHCEASFPVKQVVNSKLPPHSWNHKPCPGVRVPVVLRCGWCGGIAVDFHCPHCKPEKTNGTTE